jgi:hypothetical protein
MTRLSQDVAFRLFVAVAIVSSFVQRRTELTLLEQQHLRILEAQSSFESMFEATFERVSDEMVLSGEKGVDACEKAGEKVDAMHAELKLKIDAVYRCVLLHRRSRYRPGAEGLSRMAQSCAVTRTHSVV